eukprot:Selendium_serpulae@DN7046_c0_g1_i1.p1
MPDRREHATGVANMRPTEMRRDPVSRIVDRRSDGQLRLRNWRSIRSVNPKMRKNVSNLISSASAPIRSVSGDFLSSQARVKPKTGQCEEDRFNILSKSKRMSEFNHTIISQY